jgi:CDP-glycerol glycerophosphotransferase
MAKISVVVPVYNVEEYLDECLASLVRQTHRDLEIVIVDDGSSDASLEIAQRHAAKDDRIKIVQRPNGGLGAARNTGIEHATGDYLAFLDSDDVLPPTAYATLLRSLEATGSDFATGNVHRLTATGTNQAPFLRTVFVRDRPKTHVKKFRELLSDRIVPNKLWRRSFWDKHGFRFPVGMLHEDIPVVIPAQFLAKSVDVIATPIYYYRVREGMDLSITQRRAEKRALLDRLKAVELACDFLAEHGQRRGLRWYEDSVIAEDLRYHLNVLEVADDEYREIFVERTNAFFERIGRRNVLKQIPAIDRLKYHLVRRRMMPELLEVLRFQREDQFDTPHVKVRGRWYGDYPYRTDRAMKIPKRMYRLGTELALVTQVDDLHWEGDQLHLGGYAFIRGIPADRKGAQRVTVLVVGTGALRRLRLALHPIRFKTRAVHRPDATTRQGLHDMSWSGFDATLSARRLRVLRRWRYGGFDVYISVRSGLIRRRRARFPMDPAQRPRAASVTLDDGTLVRAVPANTGSIRVRVAGHWAALSEHRREGDEIVVRGTLRMPRDAMLKVELLRIDGSATLEYPISVVDHTYEARIPIAELADEHELETPWWLLITHDQRRHRVQFPPDLTAGVWQQGDREIAFRRSAQGDAVLEDRRPRPVLTDARWTAAGDLELEGDLHAEPRSCELFLTNRELLLEAAFPIEAGEGPGRFRARITAARMPSLAGPLPLREGPWDMQARPVGAVADADAVPVMLSDDLHARLPIGTEIDHKPFALGTTRNETAIVAVRSDLDADERGAYHQRRLRRVAYRAQRTDPIEDMVVYTSFNGRQCSDSPRAIFDELVRRGAPLEHRWVIADGMAIAPEGSRAVREGSREHYEVLARARYVITNDHFPVFFRRREDQVCLQTWHGTPLKRLGFDVSAMHKTKREFEIHWEEQRRNWQYVISPNRFSTPILQSAYQLDSEMIETGYPRVDVLARPDAQDAGRRLRATLGVPEGVRTVLYAPTFRDQVTDRRGRYRLDLHLDLDRLRQAVGKDTVILFRKHHYVLDPVPATPDGFVRDVTSYPDATELMLAADVLLTDYSSMMFDFANTGRPMLFFTYDLATYRDEVRGFYFDFLERAPGPLLDTSDQVAEALQDLDAVRTRYEQRHAAFVAEFCALDDGHAAGRVVDRVLGQE